MQAESSLRLVLRGARGEIRRDGSAVLQRQRRRWQPTQTEKQAQTSRGEVRSKTASENISFITTSLAKCSRQASNEFPNANTADLARVQIEAGSSLKSKARWCKTTALGRQAQSKATPRRQEINMGSSRTHVCTGCPGWKTLAVADRDEVCALQSQGTVKSKHREQMSKNKPFWQGFNTRNQKQAATVEVTRQCSAIISASVTCVGVRRGWRAQTAKAKSQMKAGHATRESRLLPPPLQLPIHCDGFG